MLDAVIIYLGHYNAYGRFIRKRQRTKCRVCNYKNNTQNIIIMVNVFSVCMPGERYNHTCIVFEMHNVKTLATRSALQLCLIPLNLHFTVL